MYSLTAQFSKGTFYCRSLSENPMCEGVQSAGQFCNNIINTRSTFEPLGFGQLTRTLGDQVPAHNFTCQFYATSRRNNQNRNTDICRPIPSFPRHSLLNPI